ncbi:MULTISPECIES: GNAT family N-acetyltransferase [Alphaproteobacteria]|uniref:N-acetyltransferase n=2 Tax=Alphaproteobacteria TaxID=28211 RepID=A0A512HCW7_9HYPH|nr:MULTISPECIES: GNAT family N-acetyltransferase [Alphaproteobacteria]GEO83288.1 N-acetyltransferase [Ciceribacter naphthalenivorans]GLR20317.1 N-acetyltransferase [Ciceribacter naphthalenivorans]GLT03173.1 N-acetyltransferase [Sphingomonas psychrolutea]
MQSAEPPVIKSDRLLLRAPVFDDFQAYADFMSSPRSAGLGGPFTLQQAWGMFCHDVAQWPLFGHGALMIERNDNRVCVGQVGLNHGPLFPEHEIGWMLYEGYEGNGYAAEAAALLRDWAIETLNLPSLVSYIDPNNTASIAVAERLGGFPDSQAKRPEPRDLVYRHLPREMRASDG